MKKSMKILLALVLVLALAGGTAFHVLGPAVKLGTMLKEVYTTQNLDFNLTLDTPEKNRWLEGSRLGTTGQTEVGFFTPGDTQKLLTRVVVDGKTTYLDFWPFFNLIGDAFFDFLEMENPLKKIPVKDLPGMLQQSGRVSFQGQQGSGERDRIYAELLALLKDCVTTDMLKGTKVKWADEGVLVTWDADKLADVVMRIGEGLNTHDRELYIHRTALMKSWGEDMDRQENLMFRLMGKAILVKAQQREKNQAQGVADLHAHIAERSADLADQIREYGAPEIHVWETDYGVAQRLKWEGTKGAYKMFMELSPSTRTEVEIPGKASAPAE